jgi:hypothetical protein
MSKPTEDHTMVLTKSENHVRAFDNTKKSANDALGNESLAEQVGRVGRLKLKDESLLTRISRVIDFRINWPMTIV